MKQFCLKNLELDIMTPINTAMYIYLRVMSYAWINIIYIEGMHGI